MQNVHVLSILMNFFTFRIERFFRFQFLCSIYADSMYILFVFPRDHDHFIISETEKSSKMEGPRRGLYRSKIKESGGEDEEPVSTDSGVGLNPIEPIPMVSLKINVATIFFVLFLSYF